MPCKELAESVFMAASRHVLTDLGMQRPPQVWKAEQVVAEPLTLAHSTRPRKDNRPQDSAEHNVPEGLSTTKDRAA